MKDTWCAVSFVYTESTAALHRALVIIIIIMVIIMIIVIIMVIIIIILVIIIIISMVFHNFSRFQFSFQICPNFFPFYLVIILIWKSWLNKNT